MKRMLLPLIKPAYTIPLALAILIGNSPSVRTQLSAQRPKPPDTGTPSGDPTPGTTRPEATCKETSKPLTALLANNGSDFTVSEYPTFLFYVPYAPEEISSIEFLLLDKTERTTIYQTSVKVTDKPGIIQVKIPANPKYALKLNEDYRWRLNLDCKPDTTVEPDQVLNGWVRRISMTPQLENRLKSVKLQEYIAYREHRIWYDAIRNLAELHSANPENHEYRRDWAELLASLGYAWVVQEPFVNSELLP